MGTYEGVSPYVSLIRINFDRQASSVGSPAEDPLSIPSSMHGLESRMVRHPRVIIDISAVLALLIALLVAVGLIESRYDAIERATDNSQNIAALVEHNVSRTVGLF